MSPKAPFILKVLNRIDRLDKESIRNYVIDLARNGENYREVLNLLPSGILVLNKGGYLSYANDQALTWLGLVRESVTQKKKFFEFISEERLKDFFKKPPASERVSQDIRIYHPREMDLRCLQVPLKAAESEEIVILMFNISIEKGRDAEHDRLARNESLLRLASGVAHEIGNPLNSINIHLNLMKKNIEALSPEARQPLMKTLAVIQNETIRLDQIVRNFLKATRRPPLRFKLENLNEIAREAVDFFRPELEKKDIQIHFKEDLTLPPFLFDRQRLYEVFINLIKNASEAMPDGGNIHVALSHKNKVCMIHINDEGSGIHEKDLGHIFEAYYTTKEEGSGLGLMLVYDAVSEHSGRIEVKSKLRQGTRFTILLPLREPKLQLPGIQ